MNMMDMKLNIKPKVLLIDDDRYVLETTALLLSDEYMTLTSPSVAQAKTMVQREAIDIAVVDLHFAGQEQDGLSFIDFILERFPEIPIIVLSGDHDTKRVVEAMRRPLIDFVAKDGEYDEVLKIALKKGLDKKREYTRKKENSPLFLTQSPKMQKVLKNLDKLLRSSSNSPILLLGESGTGKEELAKYIAGFLSKKLFPINMSSIPKDIAESELFGHIKGSFTGATANKAGLITQAHNHVSFLDEIGDCSYNIQTKLLRTLQEKQVLPVGSTQAFSIEVRFVTATHQNLEQLVEEKLFRWDLLQRLNAFTFKIPSLRERPEDITLYTNLFLHQFLKDTTFRIEPSGLEALHCHPWKGNIRELKNVIERIVVCSDRQVLDAENVLKALDSEECPVQIGESLFTQSKKSQIIDALTKLNGNKTHAAKMLGVHKATLHRWIKELGLEGIVNTSKGRPKGSESLVGLEHLQTIGG